MKNSVRRTCAAIAIVQVSPAISDETAEHQTKDVRHEAHTAEATEEGGQQRPSNGYAGRMDLIEGHDGLRCGERQSARIAAENLWHGVWIAGVARRHGVTHWQAYEWQKKLAAGKLGGLGRNEGGSPPSPLVVETSRDTISHPPKRSRRPSRPCPCP